MTSFHATHVPPFAWTTHRYNHCLKSVFPNVDRNSCSSPRLRPVTRKSASSRKSDFRRDGLNSAADILYQQRVTIKVFTGNRCPFKRSVKDITERLSRYDSARRSAEPEKLFPPLQSANGGTVGQKYSAQDVQDIVDRLSTYDPEKVPESKGYQIQLAVPIIYKKKYSKLEVQDIVDRLMDYDPERFPAESKGTAPMVLHELPRQTMARPRKCTAQEVQNLVDRLCKREPDKWPLDKRHRIISAFSTVLTTEQSQRTL